MCMFTFIYTCSISPSNPNPLDTPARPADLYVYIYIYRDMRSYYLDIFSYIYTYICISSPRQGLDVFWVRRLGAYSQLEWSSSYQGQLVGVGCFLLKRRGMFLWNVSFAKDGLKLVSKMVYLHLYLGKMNHIFLPVFVFTLFFGG